MNSLAISGLDYRKPWYFGGRGRGKRHNQPLEPLPPPSSGAGGGGGGGGGSAGGVSVQAEGTTVPAAVQGSLEHHRDSRDIRDRDSIAGILQYQQSGSRSSQDHPDFKEPGTEEAAGEGADSMPDRWTGKPYPGGAVAALFGSPRPALIGG